jgi:hypothetical protein
MSFTYLSQINFYLNLDFEDIIRSPEYNRVDNVSREMRFFLLALGYIIAIQKLYCHTSNRKTEFAMCYNIINIRYLSR